MFLLSLAWRGHFSSTIMQNATLQLTVYKKILWSFLQPSMYIYIWSFPYFAVIVCCKPISVCSFCIETVIAEKVWIMAYRSLFK